MGKKNKKEKKGKGKEKTDQKAEKKAEKRFKKELAEKGEEDIEKLIAEFQEKDRRKVEVIEEKSSPPSPRCNISLVAHPDRDELLMFGGEYYTGNKMYVYNDLFVYQTKKREWLKLSIPNPPPPRSAHQAVTVGHQGGQMWVFGGEFSSHSQAQFYHYKDLWVLHLKEKRWEQVKAPGAPSARSGHRMVALKKKLFVFGGFHDNTRDYKYFSDLYIFNLETFTWSSITPSGAAPSPRSGCVMLSMPETSKILIYGGYSKEKMKKDIDVGKTFTDMFTLSEEKKKESSSEGEKWKWQPVKQSGLRPSQRSGMTGVTAPGNRAFLFGGVFDEDEDDEDMESNFFKELWTIDLDKCKWFQGQLRGKKSAIGEKKKRRRKDKDEAKAGEESEEGEDEDEDEEDEDAAEAIEGAQDAMENLELNQQEAAVSSNSESVFTVTQSASSAPTASQAKDSDMGDVTMEVDMFWPSPRINAALAVRDGMLYMYGGIVEEGDKQVTLADFYCLDINKMDEWSVIIAEDRKLQEWDDDSSDDEQAGAKATRKRAHEDDEDDDDDDDDDSDDSMDITFDDAPPRGEGEGIVDYFNRSQAYWVEKARSFYEEEGETRVNERRLVRFAKELCEEACDR